MRYSWVVRSVLLCMPVICIVAAAYAAQQNGITLRNIPGAPLKMSVPAGYCEVNPSGTEAERLQYSLVEKGLKDGAVLAYLTDCESHSKLDNVVFLESWILVAGKLTNSTVQPMPGYTRAQVLDAMEAATPTIVAAGAQVTSNLEQAFKEFGLDVQMQTKMLGMLARDGNGFYHGIAQRQVLNGQTFDVVGVGGGTYVRNYLISINVYGQNKSPQTINELLNVSKQIHRDFVALNEPAR